MERSPTNLHDHALVLAGGDPVDPSLRDALPPRPFVIAADSGLSQAAALGVPVHVAVGDMDSVDLEALDAAEATGTKVERHPADKDATDLELAVQYAVDAGFRRVIVVGGHGGRLSHLLGNALLLASERFRDADVEWRIRNTRIRVVRPDRPVVIDGVPGELVSLLAVGGPAGDVSSRGLRWRLRGDTLEPGSTRGISNELIAPRATVSVGSGVLLAIHERMVTA